MDRVGAKIKERSENDAKDNATRHMTYFVKLSSIRILTKLCLFFRLTFPSIDVKYLMYARIDNHMSRSQGEQTIIQALYNPTEITYHATGWPNL